MLYWNKIIHIYFIKIKFKMETSPFDSMMDIGIDILTHLNNNSSKGSEFLEILVDLLEPYFAKRSEHESLHNHISNNSPEKIAATASSKGIILGDSDSIRIRIDTLHRNIDDINYELTDIRKKLTSKTGKVVILIQSHNPMLKSIGIWHLIYS